MARLYWRVKIDGKWTWRPAIDDFGNYMNIEDHMLAKFAKEEEE